MLKRRAPRSRRLAFRLALVFASGCLLWPAGAMPDPRQPGASTDNTAPNGLVVVIENTPKDARLNLQTLSNPYISGVALQIHWADLEPEQGKPDWSKLDQLFAAAESSNKWVQLLIFPGFFSPPWALEGVKTDQFPIQYGPGKGTMLTLPMPWDRVYLNRWFAFVKELSDRYGNSPAFRVVAAAGPTSVSAEFTLPNSPEDIQKWRADGYTPSNFIGAWREVSQTYAADFPNQYVSLSLGFGLNINEQGKMGPEREKSRQQIIDDAMSALGSRFVLQMSNLDGVQGPSKGPDLEIVIGYAGKTVTGLQLRTSCERNSEDMGAKGNPAIALKTAFDKGMAPNASGQHVNYIEVYAPDVLADDLQPVLRDGASRFGP